MYLSVVTALGGVLPIMYMIDNGRTLGYFELAAQKCEHG